MCYIKKERNETKWINGDSNSSQWRLYSKTYFNRIGKDNIQMSRLLLLCGIKVGTCPRDSHVWKETKMLPNGRKFMQRSTHACYLNIGKVLQEGRPLTNLHFAQNRRGEPPTRDVGSYYNSPTKYAFYSITIDR